MADKIIPPRRNEVLIDKSGAGTTRHMEYLERTADNINNTVEVVEDFSPETGSPASLAALSKRIASLETLLDVAPVGDDKARKAADNLGLLLDVSEIGGLKADSMQSKIIATAASLTTTGNQIIICTNSTAITITLRTTPKDGEVVTVKRQNSGPVSVSGTIDGQSSIDIGGRYSSPTLVYTNAAGEWSII